MIIRGYDVFKRQFSPSKMPNKWEIFSLLLSLVGITSLIFSFFKICYIFLSLSLFGASILIIILALWLNRKYDHVKLFYKELDFQKIYENDELKNELANTNINGIITVIEKRNEKYVSTYKMVWTIATVLLFPVIIGSFDNIKDFSVLTMGYIFILLIFFLSVMCVFQMLYPLSREKQALNAYLEYLIQMNENE